MSEGYRALWALRALAVAKEKIFLQHILLGKTMGGMWWLQGCKHLGPWNIRKQEQGAADPEGDAASPLRILLHGKGFSVNPGL